MKSRRSWLMGLALGAALFLSGPNFVRAQKIGVESGLINVPQSFTYQGLIMAGTNPIPNGAHQVSITFTDPNGVTFTQGPVAVSTSDGIFNMVIGPFPGTFSFNGQVTISNLTVDGTSITLTDPSNKVFAAPYAINAGTVNGLTASPVPVAGSLFPVPIGSGYTGAAKIDPAFLPAGIPNNLLATQDITTINSVPPASTGDFTVTGTGGVTVTNDAHGITITGSGSGVQSVQGGQGINVSPSTGNVVVSIQPGAITGGMIGAGAITGQKISGIAGQGLTQDANGFLDVNVDNSTIGITSIPNGNYLEVLPGGIGTLQLANGAVTNAKIATPWMNFTSSAGTLLPPGQVFLGGTGNYDLNLGHTNTWLIVQNFRNVTDTGTFTNAGALNETGASTLVGTLNQSGGNVNLLSAGLAGNTVTVGIPGGNNLTTLYGPITQQGGVANINVNSNFATNINTGNSTGNVSIGNNTALQTNSVAIMAGGAGTVSVTGATNVNTGAGNGNTSIGNTSNTLTTNASSETVNTALNFTLTSGNSNNITAPTNNITGVTNVNASAK